MERIAVTLEDFDISVQLFKELGTPASASYENFREQALPKNTVVEKITLLFAP